MVVLFAEYDLQARSNRRESHLAEFSQPDSRSSCSTWTWAFFEVTRGADYVPLSSLIYETVDTTWLQIDR